MSTAAEDFRRTAEKIGRRVSEQAVWHEDRCNWVGAEPLERQEGGVQPGATYRALGPDLYSGTSGVALFLAELFRVAEEPEFGRVAFAAIRQAISRADAIPSNLRLGLFTGWMGIALVAVRVAIVSGAQTLLNQALDLLRRSSAENVDPDQFDLMSGRAGAIAALVVLNQVFNDSFLMDFAIRLGDEMLESADRADIGYSWKSPGLRNWHNLTGFSHGTAGAAYALLELFHATGMNRYRDAALLAFEYERHWFDPGVENWPDFRKDPFSPYRNNRTYSHMTFWCHGAPGIALSRLRACEITGDATCRAEAIVALRTTRAAIESALAVWAENFSMCHGLAGNAEVLTYGAEILDPAREENAATALKVASCGMERYSAPEASWPCGTHVGETPNLMLGLAGIGHYYLRLHEPSIPSILILRNEAWKAGSSALSGVGIAG